MTTTNTPDLALRRRVAEARGFRYWLERRGEYELAVTQPPGEREPWCKCRYERHEQEAKRYREVDFAAAHKAGFFGRDTTPAYELDIAAAFSLLDGLTYAIDNYEPGVTCTIGTGQASYDSIAPTAPRAICLAYLAGVEAKTDSP